MKHALALCISLCLITGFSASAAEKPYVDPIGKTLYTQYCQACHGMKGKGDGPAAKSFKVNPSDLTKIAARRQGDFSVLSVAATIDGRTEFRAHGKSMMPVWGERFATEIGDGIFTEEMVSGRVLQIVNYLKSLQKP